MFLIVTYLRKFLEVLKNVIPKLKRGLVVYVLIIVIMVTFISAFLFYFSEKEAQNISLFDSFYWAFITMATIGYGDITPQTSMSKVLAMITAIAGIASFTVLISVIVEAFVSTTVSKMLGIQTVKAEGHYVIIGRGEVVSSATNELIESMQKKLTAKAKIVLIVLNDDEKRKISVPEDYAEILVGDYFNEQTFERASIHKASYIIIATGDESSNVLLVLTLRKYLSEKGNREAKIVVGALKGSSVSLLKHAGADYVIAIENFGGRLLANATFDPAVSALFEDLSTIEYGSKIISIPGKFFEGWTLYDAFHELYEKYNSILIGLSEKGSKIIIAPPMQQKINDKMRLIIMGPVDKVEALRHLCKLRKIE